MAGLQIGIERDGAISACVVESARDDAAVEYRLHHLTRKRRADQYGPELIGRVSAVNKRGRLGDEIGNGLQLKLTDRICFIEIELARPPKSTSLSSAKSICASCSKTCPARVLARSITAML
ncbi:MAG: hypothetical protein AAGK78_00710 [Planctomycetota bacterium]